MGDSYKVTTVKIDDTIYALIAAYADYGFTILDMTTPESPTLVFNVTGNIDIHKFKTVGRYRNCDLSHLSVKWCKWVYVDGAYPAKSITLYVICMCINCIVSNGACSCNILYAV